MAKDRYSNDLPNQEGFYWVIDIMKLPTIVFITKKVRGDRKVMNFDKQFYNLEYFCSKFEGLLWYGPLDEPERI